MKILTGIEKDYKMRKILIFDKFVTGHNMEYLHHLYMGGVDRSEHQYFIAVPKAFVQEKGKLEWPKANNIHFCYLPDSIGLERKQTKTFFSDVKILSDLIRQNDINEIFFVNWTSPLVYWFLPSTVSISGITYVVYLYLWDKLSFATKVKKVVKELMLVLNPRVKRNFVLNDPVAARYLSQLYKSNIYFNLPDPVFIRDYVAKDVRSDLQIAKEKKIILFFGNLSYRKGTMTILDSISLLSKEDVSKYHFIMAGRLSDEIKGKFYEKFNRIKETKPITLIEGFCSYEQINDLCYTCDILLAPYNGTAQSSGIIAYAAHYRKPVIVPDEGLLGRLVKRYELGWAVKNLTAKKLYEAYSAQCMSGEKAKEYEKDNSITNFVSSILD